MKPGRFIKHDRYLDTCLRIRSSFDYGHGFEVKAEAWNIGYSESFPLGIIFRVNIAKNEKDIKDSSGRRTSLNEWSELLDWTDKCFRNSRWRRL